jgi:hypothetical protein
LRLYRSCHDETPSPSCRRYLVDLGATAAVAAPSRFEEGVFTELNRFRSDPAAYAEYLRDYRPRFEGKLLVSDDDSEIDIMTREGVACGRRGDPRPPPRKAAARTRMERRAGTRGGRPCRGAVTVGRGRSLHAGQRPGRTDEGARRRALCQRSHHLWPSHPEGVVDQLLIDDGVPDRGHRFSLLRPTHRYAGVACGRHPVHRTMCVTLMSQTRDGSPPPPPQTKSTLTARACDGVLL